jgi:dTDP-4-dehydrorhamnose reductase
MKTTPLKIAILGARGRLGAALVKAWSDLHDVRGFARPEFDLFDLNSIERAIAEKDPFDWVVNCAAHTNVDACEKLPEEARLAEAASRADEDKRRAAAAAAAKPAEAASPPPATKNIDRRR